MQVVDRRHEEEDEERRHEGERCDVHRVCGAERRDRKAPDRGPEDARGPVDPEVGRVGARQLVRLDERRDHAEVRRHAPRDLDRPEKETDEVQEVEAEDADRDRDRDGERERDTERVAGDEKFSLIRAIDQNAEDAAEEDIWQRLHQTERGGRGDGVSQVKDEER